MSNIRKLITALVEPLQTLEDTIQTMLVQRSVDTATGWWLEQLGALVGQPRNGVTDDALYRRYVRARILTHRSHGTPEQIYKIAQLVLGEGNYTLAIEVQGTAAYVIRVGGIEADWEVATVLMSFLRKATSAGVRVILEFFVGDETAAFCFEDGDGLGWGDYNNPATGGEFASAME